MIWSLGLHRNAKHIRLDTYTQTIRFKDKIIVKGICTDGYFIYKFSYSGWTSAGGKQEAGDKWCNLILCSVCPYGLLSSNGSGSPLYYDCLAYGEGVACVYSYSCEHTHTNTHYSWFICTDMHTHACIYTCTDTHAIRTYTYKLCMHKGTKGATTAVIHNMKFHDMTWRIAYFASWHRKL